MAILRLMHRAQGNEATIRGQGVETLRDLLHRLEPALRQVQHSCEEQFPTLCVEWDPFDPQKVSFERWCDGRWDALYWLRVTTTCPGRDARLGFEVDAKTRWEEMGQPLGVAIGEYLREADWSGVVPFMGTGLNGQSGESVSVQFQVMTAMMRYSGEGVHLYEEQVGL